MSDVIYIREAAQKYNMQNGYSKADGMGGRLIKQGILVFFEAISDENRSAIYNASKAAKHYVQAEIVSGNMERENQEKEEKKWLKEIMKFIENHDHYTKPQGQNLIWREPSPEERAAEIEKSAEEMLQRAQAIRDAGTTKEKEEKLEEFKEDLRPQPKKELSKPVGVVVGAANTAGGGRG